MSIKNGYFSKYFELSRGIRQGCPISALFFILVAEVMAIKIRNDEKVCGIKFRNIEYKICQLADDTTIFVKDTDSIIQLLSVMKKFQNCSGLKINVEKTEVIPVGIYKFKNKTLPKEISRIKINHGSFKTLGIWFSYNSKENVELTFEVKLKKNGNNIEHLEKKKPLIKG